MPPRIFAFRIVQATLVVILANLLAACGSGPSTPSPTPSNGSAVLYAVGFGSPDGVNGLDAFRIDPQTHGITSFSSAGLGGNGVPLGLFADKTGNFLLTAVNTFPGPTAVLSFKRNSDGTLTPATNMTIAGSGSSIAIDPQNRFFYVGTFVNTTPVLNVLGFDSTSGALTPVSTFQLTDGDVGAMSADSSGNFLYVAFAGPAPFTSGGIAELSVGSDGTIMQKGSVSLTGARFPKALFADSSNVYVGNETGGIYAFSIDADTGLLTAVNGSPFPTNTETTLSFLLSGDILDVGANSNLNPGPPEDPESVFAFQIQNGGALVPVAGSPFLSGFNAQCLTTLDQFLYVGTQEGIQGFAIDGSSGALTLEFTTAPGISYQGCVAFQSVSAAGL